ncbi:MAG: 5'/3'-nucleotidase SurE [Bacteroidales bacterium]|nr:5'/3'-nucleotidase SurE [Bacteroidales bacterium]MDD3201871.1 5'/3'-nucleotidase SurE [Bacteroidales bacterium]
MRKITIFAVMNQIREIIVTNDDSYAAEGILVAAQLMREYGNVTIVAPKEPQSGKSASISLDMTMRLTKVSEEEAEGDLHSLAVYTFTGTPVDCVKMAMNMFLERGIMPDLLVSGINHGSNASVASVYSGTLGATAEGTIYGVPSIGLSINTHSMNPDFSGLVYYARKIMDMYFSDKGGFREGDYLNINFPDIPMEKIKGIKVAHQGKGQWVREFEKRVDPKGRDYYWMIGTFNDLDEDSRGDHHVVDDGYISIVPHRVDSTDYEEMERLKSVWKLE